MNNYTNITQYYTNNKK